MQLSKHGKRVLSLVLSAALTLSVVPFGAHAAPGETIAGEVQTIPVKASEITARENNFNRGWKFYLGDNKSAQNQNFNDSQWDTVDLPHDFSISQNFTTDGEAESGFLPGGTGWYRKSFTLSEDLAGQRILLNFDGVYSEAWIYVNGQYVGENHYGYSNFAFDISGFLTYDGVTENVIAVKAVNNLPSSRWYSGSGIYRDVTMIVTDPVHVDRHGVAVTTPNIENNDGTVNAAVTVVNDGNTPASVQVTGTVLKDGLEEASVSSPMQTVGSHSSAAVTVNPVVPAPELWSTENPALYTLRTEVKVDGQVVDTTETTFGFRYFSFDSRGFHLNGKNVKLNGVCMHHDQGALGAAAYYDAMYRQLSIMKDMGVNAIRTSHNPADEQYLQICNELGLLVFEEAFDGWNAAKNDNHNDFARFFEQHIAESNGLYGADPSMTWAQFALQSMIRRDRNNPAIIAWSLGNEIQEGTNGQTVHEFPAIAQNLINWVKEVDDTRPVTTGDNNRGDNSNLVSVINTITSNGGIAGFNYAKTAGALADLASRFGGMGCIVASETASATNSRGIYTSQSRNQGVDGKMHLTSYDTSMVDWGLTAHDSIYNTYQNDNVAGEFVWTGFDYIGEPTPYNGTRRGQAPNGRGSTPNSSYFGIVDTTGFEKDTYYLYRSQWNKDETTLHLVTAWDADNQMKDWSGNTPVWIYSNAPVVKLYRDNVLIGTATRQANTSAAGHTYYTYSTQSDNTMVCGAVTGYGADALYAVFNVEYTPGTISAKAFDTEGHEIPLTGNSGRNSISTPGAPAKLEISQNQTVVDADGESLVYITVDVTDAKGNFDTTATNHIRFSLTGNGEILGVDNGDQATNDKFQQPSVLKSTTEAEINAYAGKALVIVRSTEDAGSFTVNVSADNLTGGSVTVTTNPVSSEAASGLTSYSMVRDYTVKVGTEPALQTQASGVMADGTQVSGTIAWEPIPAETYLTPGDHTVSGSLTFAGQTPIAVSCRLHVIADVIALRNVSTAVMVGGVPALPATVSGVLADGTLSGEFTVDWESVDASMFGNLGEVVVVNGTAAIFGEERLSVTMSVRVAEAVATESVNVAPMASALEQDIAPGKQSDNLASIRNGTKDPGDNTNERWSNWGNRTTSDQAVLTLRWDTAQTIGSVNLYYYYDNCAAKPQSVEFRYSANGSEYQVIGHTEKKVENLNPGEMYTYTFDKPVNPVALQIVLTQQGGTTGSHCVALTEAEIMSYAGRLEYNTSAALSELTVDGVSVEGFAPDTLNYQVSGNQIAAKSAANAGITVLPALENVVRILTVAENGIDTRTYGVTLSDECAHGNTEIRGRVEATCTEAGYTGDTWCTDCNQKIAEGTAIQPLGHSWDGGKVTKEPTATEPGIRTFTCTRCGETRTEEIPAKGEPVEKTAPSVGLSLSQKDGVIYITGQIEDYEHIGNYYDITSQGILLINRGRMRGRYLTVNTYGRSQAEVANCQEDGSFVCKFTKPSASAGYVFRAYVTYVHPNTGKTVYVYSDMITASLHTIPQQ